MSNQNPVAGSLERRWPSTVADDELRLQWEFLSFLRTTVVNKVAGLDATLAAATPLPTSPFMSLGGIVRHLTAVERFWLSIVGGGSDLPSLWVKEDVHAEWRLDGRGTPSGLVAAYREEWLRSERALAHRTADDRAARSVDGKDYTVRWLLGHAIQETARHVGHMDVLRELADGARGE
ncbi:DinB family protein [Streptomyces sp. BE303]|uniref:DinB family protein n=1 Tax=Streptomyces sp. BE303 TaxID=3002528 RepID=UPI002E75D52D|nr:DinB family protein [Streptomyces sp. BE303]MED7947484.1 DinB family protein [Streptomyces sp. BE303]